MGELTVAVVSAERSIWEGKAKTIVAKTPDGEMGVMPGHAPVLALLLEAPLRVETVDGTKVLVAVHGGFFSVDNDRVNVIAETAELAEQIDIERAKAALERARQATKSPDDPEAAAARRAETRLAVAVGHR